jgi:hypothetical protein
MRAAAPEDAIPSPSGGRRGSKGMVGVKAVGIVFGSGRWEEGCGGLMKVRFGEHKSCGGKYAH